MKKEEKILIVTPFENCNFKFDYQLTRKINKPKEFPHNMQLDNMRLLQEKYYPLFDGEAAIYLKDAEFVEFEYLLYKIRYRHMGTDLVNLGYRIMLCNPHFTKEQLFDCLHHIAINFIQIPTNLPKLNATIYKQGYSTFMEKNRKRIEIGVEQITSIPFRGKIKKCKIVYNSDYELTTDEKRELANKVQGQDKSSNTLEEIYSTFINWDSEEKPTQINIAKKLGIHENTVKNYWKQVKQKASVPI